MLNCTSLINAYDNDTEIWLDEDITSIFAPDLSFNTSSFWIGFVITLFILVLISFITSYIYYPLYDKINDKNQ